MRQEAARFNWLAAGRRWRKTTLAMTIAVEAALTGQIVLWTGPTYDQVRVGWDETYRAAAGVARFNHSRMMATFPTGGKILFRSLDNPDNARGHTADGCVIDEAGTVKEQAWYEILRPMLVDTQGWLWAIGTPNGRNWFWREHHAALGQGDAATWQAPTLGVEVVGNELQRRPHPLENPNISFNEIKHSFETMPQRVFEQEILATFLEGEGQVFRNIQACLKAPLDASPADHVGHYIVAGVDWGQVNDFTAISVVCGTCRQELALDRFRQIDYALQRGRLEALVHKWGVSRILAESNSMGQPIIEQLQRDGLRVSGFQTTAQSKPPLIESLVLALEKEEFQWLDLDFATAELEAYSRTVSPTTGRSSYSAPSGLHDDTIVSRALALKAGQTGSRSLNWLTSELHKETRWSPTGRRSSLRRWRR